MRKVGVLSFSCLVWGLSCVARFRRLVIVGAVSVVCVLAALYWIGVSVPPSAPTSNKSAAVRDTFVSRIERPLTDPKIMQGILSKLETTLVQPLGQSRRPVGSSNASVGGSQGGTSSQSPIRNPISNPGPSQSSPRATGQPSSQTAAPADGQQIIDSNHSPARGTPSQSTQVGSGPDSPPMVRGTTLLHTSTSGAVKDGSAVPAEDGSSGSQNIAGPVGTVAGPSTTGKNGSAPGNAGHARDANGEGNKAGGSDPGSPSRSGVGSGLGGSSTGSNSDHGSAPGSGTASGSSSGSSSGNSTSGAGTSGGPTNGVNGSSGSSSGAAVRDAALAFVT